ncbi:unnamed protein product, partial [Sphacelaria rigidula]
SDQPGPNDGQFRPSFDRLSHGKQEAPGLKTLSHFSCAWRSHPVVAPLPFQLRLRFRLPFAASYVSYASHCGIIYQCCTGALLPPFDLPSVCDTWITCAIVHTVHLLYVQ